MNTLTFNTHSIGASTPSGGLWRRAANLYWTGWNQYAASMNTDVGLRAEFPLPRRLRNRSVSAGTINGSGNHAA